MYEVLGVVGKQEKMNAYFSDLENIKGGASI